MGTYIDVDELRAHLGVDSTAAPDSVLSDYIDALEEEIDDRFGVLGPVTIRVTPPHGNDLLLLPRKAAGITSVVELDSGPVEGQTTTTLTNTDYAVRGRYALERLGTGPNPRRYWSAYGVDVTFLPIDDSARRKLAIVDVAKLEAGTVGLGSVGGASVRIGDYSESSGGSTGGSVDATKLERDRNAVLRRLRHEKLVLR